MEFEWPEEFETYLNELLEWNKKFNLTSITDREEAKLKHFYDSLALQDAFDFSIGQPAVIDVGSGGGFPGLPMKIKFPNIKLTLLDSTEKKVKFLRHIISLLKLEEAEAVWARAEDHAREKRDYYDAAFCRALAPLNIAAEFCLPFVKKGGRVFAMKSRNIEKELKESENAIKILGGEIEKIVETQLRCGKNDLLYRAIIVIRKKKDTPPGYPRKAGSPKKRPL